MQIFAFLVLGLLCLWGSSTLASPEQQAGQSQASSNQSVQSQEDPTTPDPRAELDTAITHAIKLLEAEDYQAFLKLYVEPEVLERITKTTPLKEFAERFAEGKATGILKVLKVVQGKKPTFNSEKTEATLKHGLQGFPSDQLTFVKVNGLWHIQN